MSRFSKSEAEARGWVFAHEREEYAVDTAAGESRTRPATYRAEKYLSSEQLINEEAETMGKLLERIALKEAQLEAADVPKRDAPVPADVPLDEAGVEQRHIILPGGEKISEAEYATIVRGNDAVVYDHEEGMVFTQPTELARESADRLQLEGRESDADDESGAEGVEKLDIDVSQEVVDLPGGATGSALIINSKDLEALEAEDRPANAVSEIAQAEKAASEGERAAVGQGIGPHGPDSPEGFMGGEPTGPILAPDETGTPEGEPSPSEVQEQAIEESQQDAGSLGDEAEHVATAKDAAAEAEQDAKDDAEEASEEEAEDEAESDHDVPDDAQEAEEDVDATAAAKSLAEEKDVDLSKVKGSGKDGRILVSDVEAVACEE